MAMTASKGAVDAAGGAVWGWPAAWGWEAPSMRESRLVLEASMEGAALADWVLPASMSLGVSVCGRQGGRTFCTPAGARSCRRRS